MHFQIEPQESLIDLLSKITKQRKEDKKYQAYSFSDLIGTLRALNNNDFNLVFSRAIWLPEAIDLNNIEAQFIPIDIGGSNYDLSLLFDLNAKKLILGLEYNCSKFDKRFISQFLNHLRNIILSLQENASLPMHEYPYLEPNEYDRLLKFGQKQFSSVPIYKPLFNRFLKIVEQYPHHAAIEDTYGILTYLDLKQQINVCVNFLCKQGIKPQDRVGLLLGRDRFIVIIMLALARLRCTYVPIEPNFPLERIKYMLSDSACHFLIVQNYYEINLELTNCLIISIDDIFKMTTKNNDIAVSDPQNHQDIMYIIYTSGTTGKPKGVPVSYASLDWLMEVTRELFFFSFQDTWSLSHSFAFDFSIWEMWGALLNGSKLFIIPDMVRKNPAQFYQFIADNKITVLNQTPSAFRQFISIDKQTQRSLNLRYIIFGGEKLQFSDIEDWLKKHGDQQPILINMYGLTEAPIHATYHRISITDKYVGNSLVGNPLPGVECYLVDGFGELVPQGILGELWLSSPYLTRGYLNNPGLNKEKFIKNKFNREAEYLIYKTGDHARWSFNGKIDFQKRKDDQLQYHGFRIELGEINTVIKNIDGVLDVITILSSDQDERNYLASFYLCAETKKCNEKKILKELKRKLPYYMIPTKIVSINSFPLTNQNKIDIDALRKLLATNSSSSVNLNATANYHTAIAGIWQEILQNKDFNLDSSFFDVGGNSINTLQLHYQLELLIGKEIPLGTLFELPTIRSQASYITGLVIPAYFEFSSSLDQVVPHIDTEAIAIVGMAVNVPGATNLNQFWQNLKEGKESIQWFIDEELAANGVSQTLFNSKNYIKAKGYIDDADMFDANFFGFSPREAEILDPQQRLFLECVWTALENAGYVSEEYAGKIGVFSGGSSIQGYYHNNILPNQKLRDFLGDYQLFIHNSMDFLSSRISFKLNFTGPSLTIQTGCSTSLVTVCQAVQSLLLGECDMAVAGGVALTLPLKSGYLYQDEMILSPDGHCRAFDENANGTVPGNGVGVVVLKRLSDAIVAKDNIHSLIKGYAVNNDGSAKFGLTSPSKKGQIAVIKSALKSANFSSETIDYIEAHGTGTLLGDPIEVEALVEVFSNRTIDSPCALGSIKTNIGHLDTAAGIIGLIKTILCLKYKQLVPSLHYKKPNARISFPKIPLYVNVETKPWEKLSHPRRAGVSSFAIGGTNAHVILEEAPHKIQNESASANQNLFIFSAKSSEALAILCSNFKLYLQNSSDNDLGNIAFTLQVGRAGLPYRAAYIASTQGELMGLLHKVKISNAISEPKVIFIFSNDASNPLAAIQWLYNKYPYFKMWVKDWAVIVQAVFQYDILQDILNSSQIFELNEKASFIQPLYIYLLKYGLAKLWKAWGVYPVALIGSGLGEFVAACLAEIWTIKDTFLILAEIIKIRDLVTAKKISQKESHTLVTKYIQQFHCHEPSVQMISQGGKPIDVASFVSAEHWIFPSFQDKLSFNSILTNFKEPNTILLNIGDDNDLISTIQPSSSEVQVLSSFLSKKDVDETKFNLNVIGQLWSKGVPIDWQKFNEGQEGHRVSLPTYPFQRKRFWIDSPSLDEVIPTESKGIKIYRPYWKRINLPNINTAEAKDESITYAIFMSSTQSNELVAEYFSQRHGNVYKIYPGASFSIKQNLLTINPSCKDHYTKILQAIGSSRRLFVIYLWSLDDENTIKENNRETIFLDNSSLLVITYFIQACYQQHLFENISLSIITNALWQIVTNDTINPVKSLLLGPALTVSKENPNIVCKVIDLTTDDENHNFPEIVPKLYDEIHASFNDSLIAYRHHQRLVRQFAHIDIPQANPLLIRNKGVYVVTGGLGHIGLTFARYLANQANVTIVLIQRSGFPQKEEWLAWLNKYPNQNSTSNKIKQLLQLEHLGSEIFLVQADVSDYEALQKSIIQVQMNFGDIHGVIHAAGVPGGKLLSQVNQEDVMTLLAAKVEGILNLHSQLNSNKLDFMLLCSAISALTGDFGQALYNSANAFLDAFAHWRSQYYGQTLAINWDAWLEGGMATSSKERSLLLQSQSGISDEEAMALMGTLFSFFEPQIIISNEELMTKFANKLNFLQGHTSIKENAAKEIDLTEWLISLWQSYLGVESVTVDEDFFEIGGDSLLAIQLASHISQKLNVDLHAHDILEKPTIGEIEARLHQLQHKENVKALDDDFSVVSLRVNKADNLNLFLVHPVGGTVYIYRDLAMQLLSSINVYGLQAKSMDWKTTPVSSVYSMARDYVAAIKRIQPTGPYYLGGASFGGMVSYEIAQQFSQLGDVVQLLIMIDTPGPQPLKNYSNEDADILTYMLEIGAQHQLDPTFFSLTLDEQLDYFLQHAGGIGQALPNFDRDHLKQYLPIYKAHMKAMFEYILMPYRQKSKVYFFRANDRDAINPQHPEQDWQSLLGDQITVINTSGNHITMLFMPHVTAVSTYLNKILAYDQVPHGKR